MEEDDDTYYEQPGEESTGGEAAGAAEEHEHSEAASAQHAAQAAGEPVKNWYIIHTYSGFENKVAESLRTRAEAFGFDKQIGQILIPTEEVVELRNGKKVTSKRLV